MGIYLEHLSQNVIPDSPVLDAGCQLCHQTSLNGGRKDRWNAFGWRVRQLFLASSETYPADLEEAFAGAGLQDSDGEGLRSQTEIRYGVQPGWTTVGSNNIFRPDGTLSRGEPIPALPATTMRDLPPVVENPIPAPVGLGEFQVSRMTVADGFNIPVFATIAPDQTDRLYVVEKTGKIIAVELDTGTKTEFFDVGNVLFNPRVGEHGLLGLAFHPDYAINGRFFTYQSEPVRANEVADFTVAAPPNHRSFIVEYQNANPNGVASITRVKTLMVIDQPQGNHNGGHIAFSPSDGFLYIASGDGGGRDDAGNGHGDFGNGRDNTNALGAILRIDVDGNNATNRQYGIPADNPFNGANDSGLDEIFVYGLRNPYRFSFDRQTSQMYVADVGQGDIEEVNLVNPADGGNNYGWNWKEGSLFFFPLGSESLPTGRQTFVSNIASPGTPMDLVDPIAEYDHDEGSSITGGYVYRGPDFSELSGRYIFGDFSARRLFYLDQNNTVKELAASPSISFPILGFAEDSAGEIYVLGDDFSSATSGILQKLVFSERADEQQICLPIRASNGSVVVICL